MILVLEEELTLSHIWCCNWKSKSVQFRRQWDFYLQAGGFLVHFLFSFFFFFFFVFEKKKKRRTCLGTLYLEELQCFEYWLSSRVMEVMQSTTILQIISINFFPVKLD